MSYKLIIHFLEIDHLDNFTDNNERIISFNSQLYFKSRKNLITVFTKVTLYFVHAKLFSVATLIVLKKTVSNKMCINIAGNCAILPPLFSLYNSFPEIKFKTRAS